LDGYAATLIRHPGIALVAAIDHEEALAHEWSGVPIDVVVLDAADEGKCGDQYPGVGVVRHIRAHQGPHRPTIVVVTGHFFDDGLRHRMAAADADFFFLRSEIRSAEKLTDIVLNPNHYLRGVPPVADPQQQRGLGITGRSKVEALVTYVEHHDLSATLDPTAPVRPATTRRSLIGHRRDLTRAAKIVPINISTGAQPGANQHEPSIRQFRRVWFWAARVKYPSQDPWLANPPKKDG
jgi:CheY-like chemotaxis protein